MAGQRMFQVPPNELDHLFIQQYVRRQGRVHLATCHGCGVIHIVSTRPFGRYLDSNLNVRRQAFACPSPLARDGAPTHRG